MASELSPKQALAIYYLLFTGKEPLQSKAQPPLTPKERKQLVEAALVEIFKKPTGRGSFLRLTDRAWSWAEENLGGTLGKSQAAGEALQFLLLKLGQYLKNNDVRLTDILVSSKSSAKNFNGDIEAAYLRITGGAFNAPVRIADLCKSLSQLNASDFIAALLKLHTAQKVFFARLDDPQSVTEEDRRFAVEVDGHEKHLVAFRN